MYTFARVVSGEETYDTQLYPVINADRLLMPEAEDGEVRRYTATRLHVQMSLPGSDERTLLDLKEISALVLLAESRIIFHCPRFDTGTTYGGLGTGAVLVGLAMTAVSKRRASMRHQGEALVGHIRYPWLHFVGGYTNKLLRSDMLVASVRMPTDQGLLTLEVRLSLAFGSDALALAKWIAQTGASFCLRQASPPSDIVPALAQVASGQIAPARDNIRGWTGYTMPWSCPVPPERNAAITAEH